MVDFKSSSIKKSRKWHFDLKFWNKLKVSQVYWATPPNTSVFIWFSKRDLKSARKKIAIIQNFNFYWKINSKIQNFIFSGRSPDFSRKTFYLRPLETQKSGIRYCLISSNHHGHLYRFINQPINSQMI